MIRYQYLSKYITSQCSKLSPYFSPIHNGKLIIMFSNLSDTVGFCGKFEYGTASLRHVCKHEEVVLATRLSHVRILQVPGRLFSQKLE